MTRLKDKLIVEIQGVDKKKVQIKIKDIIEDWEKEPASACNQSEKKYGDIIGGHRFVFFSEKRWLDSATTKSRDAINILKKNLGLKDEIKQKLIEYIQKIEDKKSNGEIDFHHGLWTDCQAKNREANYKLAIELKKQIDANEMQPIKDIFTNLLPIRRSLMDKSFTEIDRGINSSDLLKIINKANPDWKPEKEEIRTQRQYPK